MAPTTDTSISALAEECSREMEQFRRGQVAAEGSCFELFRRAIVDRSEDAWNEIYRQYHRLVRYWLQVPSPEDEDLADDVFTNFWQHVPPDRFTRDFPNIRAVLGFLRVSAVNSAINWSRRDAKVRIEAEAADFAAPESPESMAIANIAHEELIARVRQCIQSEDEALVVELSYSAGLKPQEIHAMLPERFPSPKHVSRCKERMLERLRRMYWSPDA